MTGFFFFIQCFSHVILMEIKTVQKTRKLLLYLLDVFISRAGVFKINKAALSLATKVVSVCRLSTVFLFREVAV